MNILMPTRYEKPRFGSGSLQTISPQMIETHRVQQLERQKEDLFRAVENGSLHHVRTQVQNHIGTGLDELRDFADYTLLARALTRNNFQIVRFLLEAGADPNTVFGEGSYFGKRTALHILLKHPALDYRILQLLLAYGANPAMTGHRNNTALHLGAIKSPGILRDLLAKLPAQNKDSTENALDVINQSLRTALWTAVCEGPLENVSTLLAAGANVHTHKKGHRPTPLEQAVHIGDPQKVRLLLEAGADPNYSDSTGQYPALVEFFERITSRDHTAAINPENYQTIFNLLLEAGADPTHEIRIGYLQKGLNLLHLAAEVSYTADYVKTLLPYYGPEKIDAVHRYEMGNAEDAMSPLLRAANKGHPDTLKIFLDLGADPTRVTSAGRTIFHLAATNPNPDVMTLLLQHFKEKGIKSISFNTPDYKGMLPVSTTISANMKDTGVLKSLLEAGATANDLLYMAICSFKEEAISLLIQKGINIHLTPHTHFTKQTPLMWAASQGYPQAVKLLLDAGADSNAQNKQKMTALHSALYHSRCVAVIKALLDHPGIDPAMVDETGKRPVDYITQKENGDGINSINSVVIPKDLMDRLLGKSAGEKSGEVS